jgi:serine/threonine protein kinase
MAPEQVRPSLGQVGPATDTWALGVLLYEMLCGRPPFAGENWQAALFQIVNDQPPRPSALNPALPREVDAIVRRALTKDPRRHYQQASDLAADLRRLAESTSLTTPPAAQLTGSLRPSVLAGQSSQPAAQHKPPQSAARLGANRPKSPVLWIMLGSVGAIIVLVVALTLLAGGSETRPLLTLVATSAKTPTFPREAILVAPQGSSQGFAYLYGAPDARTGYVALFLPDRPGITIIGDYVTGDVMFGWDSWYPAEYTSETQQRFSGYVPCAYVVWANNGQRACPANTRP